MKSNKSKSNKKTAKKATRRVAKKELEESIMAKFSEVIANLGHDASKLGKDIKKASRELAKKLAEKFHDVKDIVGDKIEASKKSKIKIKKPLTTPRTPTTKSVAKAEKVVARVSRINAEVKPKRAYTRRAITPVDGEKKAVASTSKTSRTSPVKSASAKKPAPTRTPKTKVPDKAEPPLAIPEITKVSNNAQDEKNNTL